jgi:hypothetical protein
MTYLVFRQLVRVFHPVLVWTAEERVIRLFPITNPVHPPSPVIQLYIAYQYVRLHQLVRHAGPDKYLPPGLFLLIAPPDPHPVPNLLH